MSGGVLAARKQMGTSPAAGGQMPDDVAEVRHRFFNLNFPEGNYGTRGREFRLILEGDYQLSGEAEVSVPTTIMGIFGFDDVDVAVACGAQVNMANTDVVMALDVTGSMSLTNPGDSAPRIEELKTTARAFHAQLEAAKSPETRIRYGFVPYSTNVNSAGLLADEWVVSNWTYQSRRLVGTGTASGTTSYWAVGSVIGGTISDSIASTYPAIVGGSGLTCNAPPASTRTFTWKMNGTTSAPFAGPPTGTLTKTNYTYTNNGDTFAVKLQGSTCQVIRTTHVNYRVSYDWVAQPALASSSRWQYRPISYDVSNWRSETAGCMEEPDTYEIDHYGNVDFSRAKDLDLDHVPSAGDPSGQWRPMYPGRIYARALRWNNTGTFNTGILTTTEEYFNPLIGDTSACPAPARPLAEMGASDVNAFLASLRPGGSTYHDIGMLWAARLLVPQGLFAAQNEDEFPSCPTSRHLIFMTDGKTAPLDLSYTAYGMEPLDRRRWSPGSPRSLTQTVEDRFAFICSEVKKRNVTVWIVAYGTEINPVMEACAGPGRTFAAQDGDELAAAFTTIANSIANLRLVRLGLRSCP